MFEISPVKLIYGGEALGFHAGQTVLTPRLLPGERAEVEEVRRQKGVIRARPLRVLKPSSARIEAQCPYFGRCGGCQYQHFSHEAQVSAKCEILRETLRRLGGVNWEQPIPAHPAPPWNYRNQAQLKVARSSSGAARLGFFEAESNRLVPIDACPILSPRLNALLAALGGDAWSGPLANCRELEVLADHNDEKVMLTLAGGWPAAEAEPLAGRCLAELGGVMTVAIKLNSETRVFGASHLICHVGDFAYRVSPTSFFQSARFLLPGLVRAVTTASANAIEAETKGASTLPLLAGSVAMDLYAGVGLFTLPLAKQFDEVIAIEAHSQAAADLAANARILEGRKIRTLHASTHDFLRRCAQMEPDLVVMDPPRAGVGPEPLRLLLALRPKRVHYLSCSPPTLARDLGFMLKHGYHLDSLELFDCFPQTYHIESLARLTHGQ